MECERSEATTTEYEESTTLSEKSTTLSEKSPINTDEEKSEYILAAGMKRKIEEEDSESDEYEYGESDDEPDDFEEEDDDEGEDEEPDLDILINGKPYSNQELLDFILDPPRDFKISNKLLNKARRYLKSVQESNGFDIADWPGCIRGLTTIVPRTKIVVGKRHRYPEGYKYMMILADMAIQGYNIDYDTKYKVERVEQVNSRLIKGYTYYITFIASLADSNHEVTFQTMIWDNTIDSVVVVDSCNIKQA